MSQRINIEAQADSVMDFLIAQCADLENLLRVARGETLAAQENDFPGLLAFVEERAMLGAKLEVYQRQAEEMRRNWNGPEAGRQQALTARAATLIVEIHAQDALTRPHLLAVRQDAANRLRTIKQTKKSLQAYLQESSVTSVACDQVC